MVWFVKQKHKEMYSSASVSRSGFIHLSEVKAFSGVIAKSGFYSFS